MFQAEIWRLLGYLVRADVAQTAANTPNNDAPSFDMAMFKQGDRISCGRSTVLLTGWYAPFAARNRSFDSGSGRVIWEFAKPVRCWAKR